MKSKRIMIIVFILIAIVQIYVPASMVWSREGIIKTGTKFKFRTAPIDPNDPFRGKYINLGFEADRFQVGLDENWEGDETVYVSLNTDSLGYARIEAVSKEKPIRNSDYVNATIRAEWPKGKIQVEYPFNRFYMEESKAYDAEVLSRNARFDTAQVAYAIVFVKDGEAVIRDVQIDGVSIQEIVKQHQQLND